MDIEMKQVSPAAMTEYNKKGKCAELERFEREKVMQIFNLTTKEPASGVLVQLGMPPWQSNLAILKTCWRTCAP
jgi:hypothetical protein